MITNKYVWVSICRISRIKRDEFVDDMRNALFERLGTSGYLRVRRAQAAAIAIALCISAVASAEEQEIEHFMEIDAESIAFSDVNEVTDSSKPISIQKGEWFFSVTQEPDRQVLIAESGDTRITQSITPKAVLKRFVFDLKTRRFEPMRQEIRIEHASERKVQEIEELTGVTAVKRYENLGFSIVTIEAEVNPVQIFRVLKDDFDDLNARILTGFFEDEPM